MRPRTRVQLIRPSRPPVIRGPELAEVVWEIAQTGIIGHDVGQVAQLRYGPRVDKDKETTSDFKPTSIATVVRVEDYPWDNEQDLITIENLVRYLQVHPEPLYRASIGLGEIDDNLAEYLTREGHPEEPLPLTLSTITLEIGSIRVGSPQTKLEHIGWIAFSLAGRGYPYPWSDQELLGRVRAIEAVQTIEGLLAQRWPVTEHPGFFEKLTLKKVANRIEHVQPGEPSWIWAVTSTER